MSNQQKRNPTPSGVNIKSNTRTVNITNVYVNKPPSQKKHCPSEQKSQAAPVKVNQPQKQHHTTKQPTTVNNFYNVTMGGNSKTKIQQNSINVPRKHEAKQPMQGGPNTFHQNRGNTVPQQQPFVKPQQHYTKPPPQQQQHPRPQQHQQHPKPQHNQQQHQPKPKVHNVNKAGQGKQVTITNVYNVTLAPSDQKGLALALKLGNLSLSKP